MIKRLLGYLLLIAVALPASAAFDIGQLMGDLARHKGGKAKFVEKKYFAILDKPVVSTGEMTYTAPDRLEKRTLTPKVETLLLDKDILSIERDKQKLSINLANQPEALAFVDSIRGTLSGNRAALEKNYALHLAGNADKWVLTLLPSDQKIASLVQRITVSGNKNQVRVIEYLQADGERRVRVTTADDPDGMRSVTLVKVRQVLPARPAQGLPAMSLLEVTIKTGRTHQIRVHLASQGHAIVGDDKYGDFDLNKRLQKQGMKRMFLHAWQLRFIHPAHQQDVQLQAELPQTLQEWLLQCTRGAIDNAQT